MFATRWVGFRLSGATAEMLFQVPAGTTAAAALTRDVSNNLSFLMCLLNISIISH